MKLCTFEYYVRRQGKACFYCGCGLNISNATRDHYIPRQFGGKGNIRLSCRDCNKAKANTLPQAFLEQIRKLFFNYYQREMGSICPT